MLKIKNIEEKLEIIHTILNMTFSGNSNSKMVGSYEHWDLVTL